MPRARNDPGYDPAPVLALFPGATANEIARALGVSQRNVVRWRNGHARLSTHTADHLAIRHLGRHPAELWPDWLWPDEAA